MAPPVIYDHTEDDACASSFLHKTIIPPQFHQNLLNEYRISIWLPPHKERARYMSPVVSYEYPVKVNVMLLTGKCAYLVDG